MSVNICLQCGTSNNAQSMVCSKCGRRLPPPDLSSPGLQLKVDQLMQRFEEIRIACDKVKNETLSFEAFADFLKLWSASLQRQKPQSLMIDDEAESQEPEEVTAVELDPNFEHFSKGLDIIWPILEDGDIDRLDRGLQVMVDGNERLLGLKPDDIGLVSDHAAQDVSCVLCGAQNNPLDPVCKACGAKLPKLAAGQQELVEHRIVTGRYEQFRQACEKVSSGKISIREFGAFLEGIQETLRARRESYMGALEDYAEFASEEVDLAKSGMDEYEQGMEELWNYVDSQDPSNIRRALEVIGSGNEKINKAMVMNRAYRAELADEFGYV